MAGAANEITQRGDIRTVGADTAGVDGQAQALGEVQIHARVIQFGKTEAGGRLHAVHPRRIDRPRRTVAVPWTARQFIELLPIALVPCMHRSSSSPFLDAAKAYRVSSY